MVNLEFSHWVDVDVGCAKEQSVCAKRRCCVGRIVGRFCLINLLLGYVFIYSLFILRVYEIFLYGIYSCGDSSEVEAEQKLLEEVVIFLL